MTALDRGYRKSLEQTVRKARRVAEAGARQALEHLAVAHHEPRAHLSTDQRSLRNRLRARARQLGDKRDARGAQQIQRLVEQCAYEHWHRMLFARFLAENGLLIEPDSSVPITLSDCRELAAEQGKPWIELASEYAVRMLPQVFRLDDPVLDIHLSAEHRADLEILLETLPADVFHATDSLGWTYQFWQADAKDAVNGSEVKIGERELAPVTQLFTEDYMVDFLLHNTLGAWWAAKLGPIAASNEIDARSRAALPTRDGLPSLDWQYLRFAVGNDGKWLPAAGTFDGWPPNAREITLLDPCMGSGHFLVFALPIIARLRMEEERLGATEAIDRVLEENLFGLELDERCTQIAAFSLAIAAWRIGGYRPLPRLNLACSGLSISASEEEWSALAGDDVARREEMKALYRAFSKAPVLGSLINPQAIVRNTWADTRGGHAQDALFDGAARGLFSLLDSAVKKSTRNDSLHELAVTASGIARAAEILIRHFVLVATNVPFRQSGELAPVLSAHIESHFPEGRANLATAFLQRMTALLANSGCIAAVSLQDWVYKDHYEKFRLFLLNISRWQLLARLGPGAFETISGEVVNVCLLLASNRQSPESHRFYSLDVQANNGVSAKASALATAHGELFSQRKQSDNPRSVIITSSLGDLPILEDFASYSNGIQAGDLARFARFFWEVPRVGDRWAFQQSTVKRTVEYGGRERIFLWEGGNGQFRDFVRERLGEGMVRSWIRGESAWGREGVLVSAMGQLPVSLYSGELFDDNSVAVVPTDPALLNAMWAFMSSPEYSKEVRRIDRSLKVRGPLVRVQFDRAAWQAVAEKDYPNGLPEPESDDPTQWLFHGHPSGSDEDTALQVAVMRLLGYQWPAELDANMRVSQRTRELIRKSESLRSLVDNDGIVCLPSVRGEETAHDRVRGLLASANVAVRTDLRHWLRNEFFQQHCALFHNRPIAWHVWDGLADGFGALVNYHKLVGAHHEGRHTLEKLTHTYIGDWITRQRAAVSSNEEGAEARLAAAVHLQSQLLRILEGEAPYDIFVRWKPLHQQPIGWEPDINDGVLINIRPFMMATPLNARGKSACILRAAPKVKWDKDRGKEPDRPREHYPWFWSWDGRTQDFGGGRGFDGVRWNDLHYTRAQKERARREHADSHEAVR